MGDAAEHPGTSTAFVTAFPNTRAHLFMVKMLLLLGCLAGGALPCPALPWPALPCPAAPVGWLRLRVRVKWSPFYLPTPASLRSRCWPAWPGPCPPHPPAALPADPPIMGQLFVSCASRDQALFFVRRPCLTNVRSAAADTPL